MDILQRILSVIPYVASNNITYKKLIPRDDGTCTEETNPLGNIVDDLFCFSPDQHLHIFCICWEGMQVPNPKMGHHLKTIWSETTQQRKNRYVADYHRYSPEIVFCQSIVNFIYRLYSDMLEFQCIADNTFDEIWDIFGEQREYDSKRVESVYRGSDNIDAAFVYFISTEVYQILMRRYSLPNLGSIIIKIPRLELREKAETVHENESDDRARILNQMIKEMSAEKQKEVFFIVEKICESERSHEMYKNSELIEDKELKPSAIERKEGRN